MVAPCTGAKRGRLDLSVGTEVAAPQHGCVFEFGSLNLSVRRQVRKGHPAAPQVAVDLPPQIRVRLFGLVFE